MKNRLLKIIACVMAVCTVLSTVACSSDPSKGKVVYGNKALGKEIYYGLKSENLEEFTVYQSQNSDIPCQKFITLPYFPGENTQIADCTVEVDNFHYNLYPEYPVIKRSKLPKDATDIDKDWVAVVITYGSYTECGKILACEGANYENGLLTLNIKYEKSNFEDLLLFMSSLCFIFKKSDIPGNIHDIKLNVNAVDRVYES